MTVPLQIHISRSTSYELQRDFKINENNMAPKQMSMLWKEYCIYFAVYVYDVI